MASIATRKVSSPVRKRWTDTRGAYRRGPCPPGRRAGTGPVRPGPGSVVLGGCGVVVAVDRSEERRVGKVCRCSCFRANNQKKDDEHLHRSYSFLAGTTLVVYI